MIVPSSKLVWDTKPGSLELGTWNLELNSDPTPEQVSVLSRIERDFSPENSWRLTLETDAVTEQQRVVWNGVRGGQPVRLESEEGGGLLRHIGVFFFSLLPGIEDLL